MDSNQHQTIYRKDYRPSTYLIDDIQLLFNLEKNTTRVVATSSFRQNPLFSQTVDLVLNGEELKLIDIKVDGKQLDKKDYKLDDKTLTIINPKEQFTLEITTEINPQGNSSLSGLYRTSSNYCTQCEAEGFRRITYYLDRPDILACFTTRIEANKKECPVMLSNGNLLEKGDLEENRHFTVWQDPFPKPSYLFALVAGELVSIEDQYITRSGREVSLQIYVEDSNRNKCSHAMKSLKKAMKWDEDVYGLEYDLDIYMIVAVDDFNMGAMENKGLNIFNSKYVLATPESATDQDYLGIEGVIAHEYFHNWTGNRVTCRDWFQLSLKEGLTVFRDQEFSSDMNSRATKRINDVRILRNFQFREDSGPMAHPVRPDSYVEINNFYTVTVYNKGAEVIRMIYHLIGPENYYKGMHLYLSRFDGQAVTCDDFVQAMMDGSGKDLKHFKNWYSQAGTPEVHVTESWDEAQEKYCLNIRQSCEPTPGQPIKQPFHIPIEIGLLQSGKTEFRQNIKDVGETHYKIELLQEEKEYVFYEVKTKPVLSFLRNFTSPVKVKLFQASEDLAFLMAHDTDPFNKWDAAYRLSTVIVKDLIEILRAGDSPCLDPSYLAAFKNTLTANATDRALTSQALTLPSEMYLAQQMDIVEPDLLNRAVQFVKREIGSQLQDVLISVYRQNIEKGGYAITPEAMGKRSLKNCCLSYLMASNDNSGDVLKMCLDQFHQKSNMTDVVAALSSLANHPGPEKDEVFLAFYQDWKNDALVLDKWFFLQATSTLPSTLSRVKELMNHEAFSIKNPNKVRSLIGAFGSINHSCFHDSSGAGYRFLAEQILTIDRFNSQIAARLVSAFTSYKNYTQKLKVMMQEQLYSISMKENISADVYEIVEKSLAARK